MLALALMVGSPIIRFLYSFAWSCPIDLDNQLIFPLVQKTILNGSIQISLKRNDFTTIIEFVIVPSSTISGTLSRNVVIDSSRTLGMFTLPLNHWSSICVMPSWKPCWPISTQVINRSLVLTVAFRGSSKHLSSVCFFRQVPVPCVRSLKLVPLTNRLEPWKFGSRKKPFLYHHPAAIPSQQQSLHRKVGMTYAPSISRLMRRIADVYSSYLC